MLLLLRVIRVTSPSLFTNTTSSEFGNRLAFVELLVTESVNCLGVNEPVLDRVTILRVSEELKEKMFKILEIIFDHGYEIRQKCKLNIIKTKVNKINNYAG